MWFVMQYLFNLKTFKHIMPFVTLYTLGSWFKIVSSNIKGFTFFPAKRSVPNCGLFWSYSWVIRFKARTGTTYLKRKESFWLIWVSIRYFRHFTVCQHTNYISNDTVCGLFKVMLPLIFQNTKWERTICGKNLAVKATNPLTTDQV